MSNEEQLKQHDQAVNQLIGLANQLKDNGGDIRIISAAMLTAAGIYATYAEAGPQGFLQDDGVNKLSDRFRQQLDFIQQRKKAELKAAGHNVEQNSPRPGVVGS